MPGSRSGPKEADSLLVASSDFTWAISKSFSLCQTWVAGVNYQVSQDIRQSYQAKARNHDEVQQRQNFKIADLGD